MPHAVSCPVGSFLAADGAAGNTIAHAGTLLALARLYRQIVPAYLGEASWVANYRGRTLFVHAASGAIATKVRQLAPTLLEGLSRRGVDCLAVQVKVSMRNTSRQETHGKTSRPLGKPARDSLDTLVASLPPSPLRAAIETLLARS